MQGLGAAGRNAGLTRLRFLLISWVILYHLELQAQVTETWTWLWPVLGRGYLGVDGFFLLSGFALWLGYGARPPHGVAGIRRFLLRRIAKIWPLHLVALLTLALLVGVAVALGVTIREPERFGARDFLLQLLLIHGWETTDRFSWNYPSWALSVEWAGYLAFPAVLALLLRLPRAGVALVPMVGFLGLWWLTLTPGNPTLNHTLHLGLVRFGFEFAAGLGLGRLATEGMLPRSVPWLAAAALPIGLWLGQDAVTAAGLAGIMLVVWQREGGRVGAGRPDLVQRLGEASFGIYLAWIFVEAGVVGLLRVIDPGAGGRVLIMLGGFLATLALGWCAWRWVEVPAHRRILERQGRPAPIGLARPAAD